ncbi:MAG: twin-arginine translocation signal domain-containing protein, partial [Acidimicrobiaceae bacterium]
MDQQEIETSGLSRRHFIQGVSSAALAAGIFSSSALNAWAASAPGKKGGTLKVGVVGGANDLFDANYIVAKADQARLMSTFETLLTFDENFVPVTKD